MSSTTVSTKYFTEPVYQSEQSATIHMHSEFRFKKSNWEYCEYIPGLATVLSFINLIAIARFAQFPSRCPKDHEYTLDPYCARMIDYSLWRLAALLLLPVISNIICAIYDYRLSRKIEAGFQQDLSFLSTFSQEGDSSPQELSKKIKKQENWRPRGLNRIAALPKMVKNARKAIKEHSKAEGDNKEREGLGNPMSFENFTGQKLNLSATLHYSQGWSERPLQDSGAIIKVPGGLLAVVFDGHGEEGHKVAAFAKEHFKKRFYYLLRKFEGNVHAAFEYLTYDVHCQVVAQRNLDVSGSTMVASFISESTGLVYTATLADSEATYFPEEEQKDRGKKKIALSCLRNWRHEAPRAVAAFCQDYPTSDWNRWRKESEWRDADPEEDLRYPPSKVDHGKTSAVSRAIGDVWNKRILHKPKISVNQLKKGTVLLYSDGISDGLSLDEMAGCVSSPEEKPTGQKIVEAALDARKLHQDRAKGLVQKTHDHLTVIAIEVK